MPNRIHLLDETVINRIAAGEVIERPASVVKELLDNAVDAGATRIEIDIEKGGRSLVRVTDDGTGMGYDDALLSLERSATSKINSAEDLLSISTMGFRGEALPSIASVSRFRLRSREKTADVGTEIVVDGGKIKGVTECGAAVGTMVEVKSLFFHVPARRKFLRAEPTEWAHIELTVRLCALAHPGIAFILTHNETEVAHYPRAANLSERLGQIFGRRWMEDVLEIEAEEGPLKIRGVIGRPGISRGNRQEHHLFVNGRPVQSGTLNYALLEGYHNTLMKGRFPVAVLFLDLPPTGVDINVHPAKREVRFRDDAVIREFIARNVAGALSKLPAAPVEVFMPSRTFASQARSVFPEPSTSSPVAGQGDFAGLSAAPHEAPLHVSPPLFTPASEPTVASIRGSQTKLESLSEKNHDFTILGAIMDLYIVAESPKGVVLIDQHAAHERVLFEQMLERVAREEILSQRLLLPVTLDFSPTEADFLRQQLEALNVTGMSVADLGGNSFMIDGLPPMIKTNHIDDFFRGMVADLQAEGGKMRKERRLSEEIIAKTVCRHAVKANDSLSLPEMEKLLIDLHACELPYTCPHGRPTMILISRQELDKKFGRDV
jgi:DNA mismatch repair protein MutL